MKRRGFLKRLMGAIATAPVVDKVVALPQEEPEEEKEDDYNDFVLTVKPGEKYVAEWGGLSCTAVESPVVKWSQVHKADSWVGYWEEK